MEKINFKEITLRIEASTRGGGIEIDLTTLGFRGEKMSAYQNYLGGGMLGRVCSNDTIRHTGDVKNYLMYSSEADALDNIADQLRKYFHDITNPCEDMWENQSYEQNQNNIESAY